MLAQRTSPWRRAVRVARPVLLALLLLPRPAEAHTGVRRSEPAAGATVRAPLSSIRLWFTERVPLAVTRVRLIGPRGDTTMLAVRQDSADAMLVLAEAAGPLAPGGYRVLWQTAGRDGHAVRGQFRFAVTGAEAPDSVTAGGPAPARGGAFNIALDSMMRERADDPATPLVAHQAEGGTEYRIARWAEFVALLVTLGAVAFHLLLARGLRARGFDLLAKDASGGARQLALAALVLLIVTGVARLYGEARALLDVTATATIPPDQVRAMLTDTGWGRGWTLGMASVLVTFIGVLAARRTAAGWTVAGIGAVGLCLAPALTGHAAATRDLSLVAIGADALHVAGAGAWLGLLLAVLMAGLPAVARRPTEERGASADALLASFHPVARACVLLVLASGIVSSWLRLRSWDALTHTSYGSLLLYKVFIFLFAGLVGLYNWKKVLPRMPHADGPRRLRRSATVELVVGAVVLALTAALVATEPPDMAGSDRATHGHPAPPSVP
ncbi:MAG TPA: CopD family protein [Gemmatimonadaceae bacterium]|nr:CopD family protein [Gemmatimonadaceae bacterium]